MGQLKNSKGNVIDGFIIIGNEGMKQAGFQRKGFETIVLKSAVRAL